MNRDTGQRESPTTVIRGSVPPYTVGLLLTAVTVWILGWYWETTTSVVTIWYRSETFAHGFMVVPIVLYLIWLRRTQLQFTPIKPARVACIPLVLAGVGWMVGELSSVLGLTQFALVAMISASVWCIAGNAMVRTLAFPLGFLFFAVPFGDFIVPTLMEWTAEFTILALRASGVPVYREGLNFVIPSGNWSVVEACSGVRYLIASVMVGVLYANLTYRSMKRRLLFVLASVAVPLVANWLRAYMIVMIGHLSDNRMAAGVDHIIYGWVFFGVVMLLLFWVASFWREDHDVSRQGSVETPTTAAGVVKLPEILVMAVIAAVMVSSWKPIASVLASQNAAAPVDLARLSGAGGWIEVGVPLSDWKPEFAHASDELSQGFGKDGDRVDLYIAYYRNQSQENELVSHHNQLVRTTNKKWIRVASGSLEPNTGSNLHAVKTAKLRGGPERLVAWQWYWVDGRWTSSDFVAKALLAWSRLTGGGDDSAVVVIYARETGSPDTNRILRAFLSEHEARIQGLLEKASSR